MALNNIHGYETVAAGQTTQALGTTGGAGDWLDKVIVSPGTVGCGVVTIFDGSTAIVSFPGGGTSALVDLKPFVIEVKSVSVSGAWNITTGANVTCVAFGDFRK